MSTIDKIKIGISIINPLEMSSFIRFWDSKVLTSNSYNDITIDRNLSNYKSDDGLPIPILIE